MPRKIRNGRILIGAIRNIREVEHWNDDEAGLRLILARNHDESLPSFVTA